MTQLQRLFIGSEQLLEGQVSLTLSQQHYLARVLRLQAGDRFIAMDGQGQWWLAVLTAPSQAQILESIAAQTELPVAVTLLIAMPKNGLDDVVRQVTELGIAEIVLVSTQRTVLKPSAQKIDRWQRIAQEAAEQSERQIVPKLHAPQAWADALQTWNASNSTCFICEARGNHPHLWSCLGKQRSDGRGQMAELAARQLGMQESFSQRSHLPIALAIGPEGGWSEIEIEQATAAGYQPVSLGSRILRSVTAPMVALSIVASVYEALPLE